MGCSGAAHARLVDVHALAVDVEVAAVEVEAREEIRASAMVEYQRATEERLAMLSVGAFLIVRMLARRDTWVGAGAESEPAHYARRRWIVGAGRLVLAGNPAVEGRQQKK